MSTILSYWQASRRNRLVRVTAQWLVAGREVLAANITNTEETIADLVEKDKYFFPALDADRMIVELRRQTYERDVAALGKALRRFGPHDIAGLYQPTRLATYSVNEFLLAVDKMITNAIPRIEFRSYEDAEAAADQQILSFNQQRLQRPRQLVRAVKFFARSKLGPGDTNG
ncbi:MAG: hypothetical protein P4M15_06005 [Alphaproteobacteria bacterium]|nr:hypothetical protein [Alphaproteobacteria bacterium]